MGRETGAACTVYKGRRTVHTHTSETLTHIAGPHLDCHAGGKAKAAVGDGDNPGHHADVEPAEPLAARLLGLRKAPLNLRALVNLREQ